MINHQPDYVVTIVSQANTESFFLNFRKISVMLNKQKYFFLFISLLFSSHLFCQNNEEDTIQWVFYSKDPWVSMYSDEKQPLQSYKNINLNITELKPESITDSCISFVDILYGNKIIICKKGFLVDQHIYDFEKYLIDGKVVFGHDGFSSIDYVKINFHSELDRICITNNKLGTDINIIKAGFPVFIHPYLTDNDGNCRVKVYRIKKYFQHLIIITGGGGGAGSYENYILIDLYNRGWIFARNINTETVSFVPISTQEDPFSKNGEKIWYQIILK